MTVASAGRQQLQGTSLEVSPLCLGGNRLGSVLSQDESFALLDAFVGLGGNFIDTALVYADWLPGVESSCSEKTLGRWLATRDDRSEFVVATKGGHHDLAAPSTPRLDAASLRADVTASIDNLGGTPIDLYYLHRDDPSRPVGALLESLESFVSEGLIRYYAASNLSASRLSEATAWAKEAGASGFVANQLEWSLARPTQKHIAPDLTWMNADLAEFHLSTRLPVIPYSSQARGYFDKVYREALPDSVQRYNSQGNADIAAVLRSIAEGYDVGVTSLALAALMSSGIQTIPVVGCRTFEQLKASWAAVDIELTPHDRAVLAELAFGRHDGSVHHSST